MKPAARLDLHKLNSKSPGRYQMIDRHVDDGSSIYDYSDHFLVACPHCTECATSIRHAKSDRMMIARFVCTQCGKIQEKEIFPGWRGGPTRDWFFGYPLWLLVPCCGHELWAHNLEHLRYIESYVSAKHRMRNPEPNTGGIRNKTMASSFPKWITDAKNRDEILKCIAGLRTKVMQNT